MSFYLDFNELPPPASRVLPAWVRTNVLARPNAPPRTCERCGTPIRVADGTVFCEGCPIPFRVVFDQARGANCCE